MDENDEYKQVIASPKLGVCNFMKSMYKMYFHEEMSKCSNLPSPETCPVPAGQYDIKQCPFDMKKFGHYKKLVRPGKYRLQSFLIKDDVAVCGIFFYGHVNERS